MNKYLALAAVAVIAASTIPMQSSTAEAGLLRRALRHHHHHHRHGLFRHRHHHRFHHHRRIIVAAPIIAAPAIAAPAYRAPTMPQPRLAAAPPQNADAMGRRFDPASMAWFDGVNQCWSGRQPWSFRNGSWFYGNNRWYPANGTWITDAPEAPTPVDCQSVPAFAQARPATQTASGADKPRRDDGGGENAATCTKYSAAIGQVINVPCGG